MAKKYISWKTKGMNRDISVSAFNAEFAFENVNLRLATNEGNTMMSWVNERGTKAMTLSIEVNTWFPSEESQNIILGTPVGTAVINHKLVVFTTDGSQSYIYVFKKYKSSDYDLEGKLLYCGNLGFSTQYPLETLVSYESESIQKVYWTDNLNQPRVINIEGTLQANNDHQFDFLPELQLKETVSVLKIFGAGEFPPGVIQYAFTYYNKHGQESNIFYTTPLQYVSYVDRGGSPEDKVANCFKITVNNLDHNFDYLRIYSILRTSLNATPLVKRVQDIEVTGGSNSITFTDSGTDGETVDPTELLYKGGEEVKVKTMEQKDETLFLGNITLTRPVLEDVKSSLLGEASKAAPLHNDNITPVLTERKYKLTSKSPFYYINTLDSSDADYQGAACFKSREYYRFGVQFQYKNGKWSEPCWIGDKGWFCDEVPSSEKESDGILSVPEFRYTMPNIFNTLYSQGYRRVRPVFAIPGSQDRTILCQGIGNPTVYRLADREGTLYGMASWLFRVPVPTFKHNDYNLDNTAGIVTGYGWLKSQFKIPFVTNDDLTKEPYVVSPYLRSTEIMGIYDDDHRYGIDEFMATINSPDIEFDDTIAHTDFVNCHVYMVGDTHFERTYGDIDIQTSTPCIGSDAGGFIHSSVKTEGYGALISGLFYNDYIVDDIESGAKFEAYHTSSPPVDFPVYMWHKNGSLNNDVARDGRSAVLLKKKISNYRLGGTTTYLKSRVDLEALDIQLFNSDVLSMVKVNGRVYQGNVDTMVSPTTPSPHYFVGSPWRSSTDTTVSTRSYYKLALATPSDTSSKSGVWTLEYNSAKDFTGWTFWTNQDTQKLDIGDYVKGLDQWREGVSIKYKSTPHLVVELTHDIFKGKIQSYESGTFKEEAIGNASIVEVSKPYQEKIMFGGTSDEALQAATWIPCGPVASFDASTESLVLEFKWGDTYFQRYECLKTYPYTNEDKNQVVEIASFMVETRVNIDGRYDRNRAQVSNLNMTPQNFNLINPVYSQMDNFFSYKMLSEDDYKNITYPNTVTWTKTKQNGADVDLWTNVTLANTLEMDGNKGSINKLVRFNNQLLSFQDSGISQILYNENTQISTTEGVPIEIANSEKVQGKRYYSDTVGCSNKWSVVATPMGIYFMDSNEKSIYLFNGQLNNLSTSGGFNSWAKQNIPSADAEWTPSDFKAFVTYYDKLNQDVLFLNEETALAFSEKFSCFTSFYDYGGVPYFESLDDMGIWIGKGGLWQHQAGEYCNFFGASKPYSMTLIANQEPQLDKMFTNLEFRACVSGEGIYDETKGKFTPSLPFDSLEAWNEYQQGKLALENKDGHDIFTHGRDSGFLARKFRIWRCDIPRNNIGTTGFKPKPLDRIRNPWAYLKLTKDAVKEGNLGKVEIHDIMATYFG